MTPFRRTARVLRFIARMLGQGLTCVGYWTAGYPPIPPDEAGTGRPAGTAGQAPGRDARCGAPPPGHPERLAAHLPPSAVERDLWRRLGGDVDRA